MSEPKQSPGYITRSSAPLALEGIRAATLASLWPLLSLDASSDPPIISDLTLGAVKAHQVALEFSKQLGLDYAPKAQLQLGTRGATIGPPSYADLMGTWIDVEACGDRTTVRSLEMATHLVNSIRSWPTLLFLGIIPSYGCSWEAENLQFVRFLAQGLKESHHRLLLISTGSEQSLPSDWIVSWTNAPETGPPVCPEGLFARIPGIVDPEIADIVEMSGYQAGRDFITLRGGYLLVAPECRRSPSDVSRFEYDRLAVVASGVKWLKAYAQLFGNTLYVDPALLVDEASRLISEGSPGLALRLLKRAATCSKAPILRASYESQAQGMRIALHRFREMAEAPDPSPALPKELRGALLQAKGWGLVMSDEPARGIGYLQEAGELLRPHYGHSREYLYFMNIYALAKLKTGDMVGALGLEKEVESLLDQDQSTDWRLKYVNSINIARLKRRMGDFDTAEQYLGQAFATIAGVRSESDSIYTNVCWARLFADLGCHEQAFISWFRSGLHWVSSVVPEALGKRVAAAIVSPLSTQENVEENVSLSLVSLILDSARRLQSESLAKAINDLYLSTRSAPAFVRADTISDPAPGTFSWSVGNEGWGILLVEKEMPPALSGPNFDLLRVLLFSMLKAMAPATDFTEVRTIAIDNCFGSEIPTTFLEMLQTCVRLAVPKMMYGTDVYDLDLACRTRLEMELRVRLSAAVARVEMNGDSANVYFKRYLPPKNLSPEESGILALLNEELTIKELLGSANSKQSREHLLGILRLLERARIVELYLSEEGATVGLYH